MKATDLRKQSKQELLQTRDDLGKSLFNLRMRRGTGQAFKPHEFNEIKKDIARINTILTELEAKN